MERKVLMLDVHVPDSMEVLHPVVLFGKNDVVLVDAGYAGTLSALESALWAQGVDPSCLSVLVLTHQDDDHMGLAAALKKNNPDLKIFASAVETPYIEGKKKNCRLAQAEALQDTLPTAQKSWGEKFCERLRAVPIVTVDQKLNDGDIFDWGGGCEIILTPGHTPGHLSLRSLANEFLITGDAAVLEKEGLIIANPEFCLDLSLAQASFEKLEPETYQCVFCYHGGMFVPTWASAVRTLTLHDLELVQSVFLDVFSVPPWNDQWTDEQLTLYLRSLLAQPYALAFGWYAEDQLVGFAMGRIKHWYTGSEFWLEEFGIHPSMQGQGLGAAFMRQIEKILYLRGMRDMVLLTDRHYPAYKFYHANGFEESEEQVLFTKLLHK